MSIFLNFTMAKVGHHILENKPQITIDLVENGKLRGEAIESSAALVPVSFSLLDRQER